MSLKWARASQPQQKLEFRIKSMKRAHVVAAQEYGKLHRRILAGIISGCRS